MLSWESVHVDSHVADVTNLQGLSSLCCPASARGLQLLHWMLYDKDATMTADRYFDMISTKVFKDIEKSFRGTGIRHVVVQQDVVGTTY